MKMQPIDHYRRQGQMAGLQLYFKDLLRSLPKPKKGTMDVFVCNPDKGTSQKEGMLYGDHVGLFSSLDGKKKKQWVIVHLPTKFKMAITKTQKIAKRIIAEFIRRYDMNFTDPKQAAAKMPGAKRVICSTWDECFPDEVKGGPNGST